MYAITIGILQSNNILLSTIKLLYLKTKYKEDSNENNKIKSDTLFSLIVK